KNETLLPAESNKTHGRQSIKIACRSETGYNTPYFQIIFRLFSEEYPRRPPAPHYQKDGFSMILLTIRY
ncbi:hypothetical protein, partial [Alistipes dispar]|uniref:hypothetical protein n=1 Tax=Alistipes dispar TaxID=2585119 RepID=UPI003A8ECDAB